MLQHQVKLGEYDTSNSQGEKAENIPSMNLFCIFSNKYLRVCGILLQPAATRVGGSSINDTVSQEASMQRVEASVQGTDQTGAVIIPKDESLASYVPNIQR